MDAPPVQYVTTSDGYNIAYAVAGRGTPLIFLMPTLGHNIRVFYRRSPEWVEGLARRFRLVICDPRGRGQSSRGLREDLSPGDFVRDIEALVDKLGSSKVLLFASGTDGHQLVRYADTHPERVEALIWNAATLENTAWPQGLFREFARENWDYFLSTLLPPGLPIEAHDQLMSDFRENITPEDYRVTQNVNLASRIEAELTRLQVPLLVLFPRQSRVVSPSEGAKVAALAPDARLVLIEGGGLFGGAAPGLAAIDAFVAGLPPAEEVATQPAGHRDLSLREVEVLRLLTQGKSNQQIADELVISLNTVRRHVSNVFDKTGAANRAQATAYAKDHGLA
jgi:pimeloyl-ACP methyl ester carboxylesterase/DNA-binding CsgD family transcriptional regulator